MTVCVMVLHPSDGRWRNRRERCSSGHRFQLDLAIRLEFVKTLFEKTGVLVTPGSAFGPSGEGHVRMALVQDEDAIALAVQRIDGSGILKSEQ